MVRTAPHARTMASALLTAAIVSLPATAGVIVAKVSGVSISQPAIYPGQIVNVSYTLSGSGLGLTGGLASVKIDFVKNGSSVKTFTLNPGDTGTAVGANTVTLNANDIPTGGPYTVRVTTVGGSVTSSTYFKVSNANDPNLQIYGPRGVDVNRNAGSPYYGRIYMTEGTAGSTKNRVTTEGVYVLNPDLTPAFPTAKATSTDIGALGPWTTSAHSPFRVYVAPDDTVFITDAADAHPAVIFSDANLTTFSNLFAHPPVGGTQSAVGLVTDADGNQVFGDTTSIWVEGSGDTRKVFCAIQEILPTDCIWQYNIPAGQTDVSQIPTLVGNPALTTGTQPWRADFVRDSAGNTYAVNYSSGNAFKFIPDSENPAATLALGTTGATGICIDEAHNAIYISTLDGKVLKTNKDFAAVETVVNGMGAVTDDIAVDGDQFIYVVDETDKVLHVWAPAGTYNVAGNSADASSTLTNVPPVVAGDIAPIGPEGLNTGTTGQHFGDGKVDAADAILALKAYAGLITLP